jgi:hypothetical protein
MSFWRRAPREVYRVYGEDQYLEGEIATSEDATTVESEGSTEASWSACTGNAPSPSPRTHSVSPTSPSGPHAGRLVGFGLLAGVGLATFALVFLNASHPRGSVPESPSRGARVEVGQRVDGASGAGRVQAIAHSENSKPVQRPHFPAWPIVAPAGSSGRQPERDAPSARDAGLAPRPERAWSAARRSPGNGAPVAVVVELPTPIVVEPPVQDEFGFER